MRAPARQESAMNAYIETLRGRHATKRFEPGHALTEAELRAIQTILRLSPSSTNLQPWHFVIAASGQGRERVARAAQGPYEYNAPKIRDCCAAIVLCTRTDVDAAYTDAVLAQEERDGRFPSAQVKAANRKGREFFADLHRTVRHDMPHWLEKQTYLALGNLLVGVAHLGLQACPMEGFDPDVLARELDLTARGLVPSVVVAVGRGAPDDFNARAPKSRWPLERVVSVI
jgi:nitroreductase/dihydropteridine reductase